MLTDGFFMKSPIFAITPVAIIALWELLFRLGTIHGFGVTAPSLIATELWKLVTGSSDYGPVWPHVWSSLVLVLVGTTIGVIVGVPAGFVFGWNGVLERLFIPLLYIIRPLPPIALLPLVVLLFGIGERARLILIFAATFPIVTFTTFQAVREVDPIVLRVAISLGASKSQLLRTALIPAALPGTLTGLRIAAGLGFMTVVAAELLGATSGLGFLLTVGSRNLDMTLICSVMVLIGLLGLFLDFTLRLVRNQLCLWEGEDAR